MSFPPAGYIQTESALPGIEIFMPAPEGEATQKPVVDFKCPNCGAPTAYSVEDGGLRCQHCGYYEPPKRAVVGKGAESFEFKVETLEQLAAQATAQSAHGWGEARKELHCQNCQARTVLPQEALSYTCPFCGSNKVIQQDAAQDALRPRFLLPFQVTLERCAPLTQTWLGSSWMIPGDLKRLARVADFVPIYLPFWTFDATTRAGWKAQVGHTVTERYRSGGEWKTRTRTVWRWESGKVAQTFDDLPLLGTAKLSRVLMSRIERFDMAQLTPYEPKFLAGMRALAYDVALEPAWKAARERMRETTREACRDQASSSQIRSFSMSLDFADESWRYILAPVYVAVYQYQGQPYQVMINGQSGEISGQRPVDWTKVWLAIAALLAPGIIASLIGVLTLVLGIGVVVGIIGLILLLIGGGISFYIYKQAEEMGHV
ncbi:MAG: hypothetical protein JW892_11475 [Anaerolineae bacterium]|nr:hypothetical protein [Anaerolineae bacterium]